MSYAVLTGWDLYCMAARGKLSRAHWDWLDQALRPAGWVGLLGIVQSLPLH